MRTKPQYFACRPQPYVRIRRHVVTDAHTSLNAFHAAIDPSWLRLVRSGIALGPAKS
jgi:hypothetical protein